MLCKKCEYAFFDIGGSDSPALFVRYETNWDYETIIYSYANGKTHELGEFWSRRPLDIVDIREFR